MPEGTPNSVIRRMCREAEAVTADLPCTVTADTAGMMDFTSFTASGLSIEIYGSDTERLQEIAAQVAEAVADTEGFTEISNGAEETAATLHLRIDKDKAMEHGLTVAQIYMQISSRLTTDVVSTAITADGLEMTVRVSNNTDPLTRENLLDLELTGTSLADAAGMADMMGIRAGRGR